MYSNRKTEEIGLEIECACYMAPCSADMALKYSARNLQM